MHSLLSFLCMYSCVMDIVAGEWYSASELCWCSDGRCEPRSTWSAMLGSGLNFSFEALPNQALVCPSCLSCVNVFCVTCICYFYPLSSCTVAGNPALSTAWFHPSSLLGFPWYRLPFVEPSNAEWITIMIILGIYGIFGCFWFSSGFVCFLQKFEDLWAYKESCFCYMPCDQLSMVVFSDATWCWTEVLGFSLSGWDA